MQDRLKDAWQQIWASERRGMNDLSPDELEQLPPLQKLLHICYTFGTEKVARRLTQLPKEQQMGMLINLSRMISLLVGADRRRHTLMLLQLLQALAASIDERWAWALYHFW